MVLFRQQGGEPAGGADNPRPAVRIGRAVRVEDTAVEPFGQIRAAEFFVHGREPGARQRVAGGRRIGGDFLQHVARSSKLAQPARALEQVLILFIPAAGRAREEGGGTSDESGLGTTAAVEAGEELLPHLRWE